MSRNALAILQTRAPYGALASLQARCAFLEAECRDLHLARRIDQLRLQEAGLGDDGVPVHSFAPWLLYAERTRQGLSMQALAGLTGYPVGSLNLWEGGTQEPSWRVIYVLARALETEMAAMVVVGK